MEIDEEEYLLFVGDIMVDNKRKDEIDWLRGFAAFLVVLGHAIIVFPVNLHDIFWCRYLYNVIYSFHMPMFFAISGYCYSIGGGITPI